MGDILGLFGIVGVFGSTSFIVYLIVDLFRNRFRIRATAELQGKVIERLTAQDIGTFLTSKNGSELLRALAERPAQAQAHVRILRALQSGLVLLALGIGCFFYVWFGPTLHVDVATAAQFVATMATALGVGLLLAAGASYVMSKRIGLLNSAEGRSADAV